MSAFCRCTFYRILCITMYCIHHIWNSRLFVLHALLRAHSCAFDNFFSFQLPGTSHWLCKGWSASDEFETLQEGCFAILLCNKWRPLALREGCWNGYINVCMICSSHLLFSFLRIFWCSHRPKESASPFNHIFPFAASLIWWGFATVDQRLQWSFHQILVRSPAALMNLLNDALPRPQEF